MDSRWRQLSQAKKKKKKKNKKKKKEIKKKKKLKKEGQKKKIPSPAINNSVMKHVEVGIWFSVVYKLGPKRTCELWAGALLFMETWWSKAVFKTQAV